MKLQDYLREKRLRPSAFAKAHDVPQSVLSKFLAGKQGLSLETAITISEATGGLVSVKDLALEYSNKKNGNCKKS